MVESSTAISNYYAFNRLAADVSYKPMDPLKLTLEGYTEFIDPSKGDEATKNGALLSATWSFSEFAGIGASCEYAESDSQTSDGDYNLMTTSLGAWLTF